MERLKLLGPIAAILGLTLAFAFFGPDAPSPPTGSPNAGSTEARSPRGATPRRGASLDAGAPPIDEGSDASEDDVEPRHPAVERLDTLLCDQLVDEVCRAQRRCGCAADPSDPRGCEERERQRCAAWLDCAAYATPDEPVAVEPTRLRACLRGIRADLASCDAWRLPQDCHELLVEAVDVGEPCTGARADCRGGTCDARCEAWPTRGERCDWRCAPGLTCGERGRCVPEGSARVDCASSWECPPRLACVDGACAPPRPAGASCADDDACARGTVCRDGRCAAVASCRIDHDCGRLSRCGGPVVDRCVPIGRWPLAPLGAECANSMECARGAACREGRCRAAPAIGEACVDARCGPGARCARGRCEPAVAAAGAPCDLYAFDPCGPGLACAWTTLPDAGTGPRCVPSAGPEAPCPTGACELGLRCTPMVDGGRCEPLLCGPESIWACDMD